MLTERQVYWNLQEEYCKKKTGCYMKEAMRPERAKIFQQREKTNRQIQQDSSYTRYLK